MKMSVCMVKILLLIVLVLGLVLILGYHHLTFGFLVFENRSGDSRPDEVNVQFNFKRQGFTSPPLVVKQESLFDEPEDVMHNRTEEAENQDVVFFNRVPKTGSEMFQEFTKVLGNTLGYHTYIDPSPMNFFPGREFDASFGEQFNKSINDTGIYFRHLPYFNFTEHNLKRPIYMSMIRNPIERVVSWYYYIRWRNRPDEQQDQKVCQISPQWKQFCDQFSIMRLQELLKPNAWFDMDFDTCVLTGHPDCDFKEGQGGWDDWSERKDSLTGKISYEPSGALYTDYRNQIMFFCGNNPDCISFNSLQSLNIAKQVVDKHYSVVGVLEHLDKSLETVEAMVPKFFRNAKDIFRRYGSNKEVTHTNKNPNKKKISDKVRNILARKFEREIEFYEFCVQRLNAQWSFVRSLSKISENVEWPVQLTDLLKESETFVLI